MNFGEKLKDLRTQKGWSQEELAKQMGVTRRTIGGYEAGTTYPRTRDMYAKLAELLETDVNYLMTENEEFMTEVGSFYGRRGQAQASEILSQTRELFAGGSLSEEDQKAFAIEVFAPLRQTALLLPKCCRARCPQARIPKAHWML